MSKASMILEILEPKDPSKISYSLILMKSQN